MCNGLCERQRNGSYNIFGYAVGFLRACRYHQHWLGYAHLGSRSYLVFAGSSFLLQTFQKTNDNYGSWLYIAVAIVASVDVATRTEHNLANLRLSMLYRKASIIWGPGTKHENNPISRKPREQFRSGGARSGCEQVRESVREPVCKGVRTS